jgi:nitric oxide reductase subunit C
MFPDRKKIKIVISLVLAFLCYSVFIYSSLPVKQYSVTDESISGKLIWQQYNCTACHQLYGLGGFLGPDLTNVYSYRGPDYIRAFVNSGTTIMPKFNLPDSEITALLTYLRIVDESGKADPRTFIIQNDGTIKQ